MTVDTLKAIYNEHSFTGDNYIVGYHKDGLVHVCIIKYHFANLAISDTSSKKCGRNTMCLRYRQTDTTIKTIRNHATDEYILCTVDELERVARAYSNRANRGKAFERLVTEHYEQTWTDDTVEWWTGADITINGIGYQIKYDRCNFCNERQVIEQGWT